MKTKQSKNYLDYIPVKNPEIEYETDENDRVTVYIEWKGFYHRIAQKFFHRPRVSDVKLDDYGSFVWLAIDDMKDSFTYQTTEAVKFSQAEVPQNSWIDGKTIGEVFFWNYTEATIVAVIGSDNIARQSVGPDFVLHSGDRLIFVGKDNLTFDRVLSFLTYGVLEQQ